MTNQPNDDFEKMLSDALGTTPSDAVERAIETTDLVQDATPADHRSGYVAVVGQPNVGKSTLMNQILGEKVAIVSPKPQTTRIQQLGIYTRDMVQIIFVDTPGIHRPKDPLSDFMNQVAKSAFDDADVILFVTDISRPPNQADKDIAKQLMDLKQPQKIIHVMNKSDKTNNPDQFLKTYEAYREMLPEIAYLGVTALDGDKIPDLLEMVIEKLPLGPRYYPIDQVSDLPVRGIAAEMIREKSLRNTKEEVPHSLAVAVDEFKKRREDLTYIHAVIYVEREGQKGIIIGKGGKMLKKISTDARHDIEAFLGTKVYLEISVKVFPNWRKDEAALRRFGYKL